MRLLLPFNHYNMTTGNPYCVIGCVWFKKNSVLVFVLVCITLCPFQFCNHLGEEDRAGRFAFIIFLMSCYYK